LPATVRPGGKSKRLMRLLGRYMAAIIKTPSGAVNLTLAKSP
jgi:hypothetical protein